MPANALVATLRATLEEERDGLVRQLGELGALETSEASDSNFADSGQAAAEQAEARVLAGALRDRVAEVERALEAMEGGEYGRCEVCGDDIGEARLEAMPTARRCITCVAKG